MAKQSAGILMYKLNRGSLEVFLVHPGGPFWTKKDLGAWTIPKGEFDNEDPAEAARREFFEETGIQVSGELLSLNPIKQKGGKTVLAWAVEGDVDPRAIQSNTFELEWPPKSGKKQLFPEVDRADWFPVQLALKKMNQAQVSFIEELMAKL